MRIQNLKLHFLGSHLLIISLKIFKFGLFLVSVGTLFHTFGQNTLSKIRPCWPVFTSEKIGLWCYIISKTLFKISHLKYIVYHVCWDVLFNLKGALSDLRWFLGIESPFKMMKNAFYFTSKGLFVLKIFKVFALKRLD